MKRTIKIIICVFLFFMFVGCSNDVNNKEKDDKNVETIKDEDSKISKYQNQSLEEKFTRLLNDLEKKDGYTLCEKVTYKEDEANGLKYIYGIEKQTDFNYELYEISVYYHKNYAIKAENQWNDVKTTSDNKRIGIYTNEEENEIYYTYREDNMIVSIGGFGNDKAILKVLKDYFKIDL